MSIYDSPANPAAKWARSVGAFLCASSLRFLRRAAPVTMIALSPELLAEPCIERGQPLSAGLARHVQYTARVHQPGYRFSIDGLSWEVVRTRVSANEGRQHFEITYPVIIDDSQSPAARDFFVSLQTRDSAKQSCSDVRFGDASPVHRLLVDDDSNAVIRFGDLDKSLKRLESTRKMATELKLRVDGTEVLISTGFATRRSLNISGCASGFDDSYGYVEYQPGQVQVSCFPADPKSTDYVDEIDWHVEFDWPQDPPELIDQLIDYVYIEPI